MVRHPEHTLLLGIFDHTVSHYDTGTFLPFIFICKANGSQCIPSWLASRLTRPGQAQGLPVWTNKPAASSANPDC